MGRRKVQTCYGCYQQIFDIKKHAKICSFIVKKIRQKRSSICFPNDLMLCLLCYSYTLKPKFKQQHQNCHRRSNKILDNYKNKIKFENSKKIKNFHIKYNLRQKSKIKYSKLIRVNFFRGQMKNHKIKKQTKTKTKSTIKTKPAKIQKFKRRSSQNIQELMNNILAPIYLVCDQNLKYIVSKNEKIPVKVASLTKLFNLMTCLNMAKQYLISLDTIFQVPQLSIRRTQTNAGLRQGDKLTLRDLIYGMLLPSGGDAAQTIAIVLGKYLIKSKKANIIKQRQAYIKKMNEDLGPHMKNTIFVDEKGYGQNFSTAQQIINILKIISQNQQALNFLKVYRHRTTVLSKFNIQKLFVWNSTNILIHNGYYGKTGTTTGYKFAYAGIKEVNGKNYYFCVLEHLSHTGRFTDVKEIINKIAKIKQK